jgi:heme-degrading monooxygenase HmoA
VIAVLFEAWLDGDHGAEYLDLAAQLRPLLDGIDGFLSVERFQSLSRPGKLLSMSFWRDEDAVRRWRELEAHRRAQARGAVSIFTDYRLRIATVIRDYGPVDRAQAPTPTPGDGRDSATYQS